MKKENITINAGSAKTIDTPREMPVEYKDFSKHQPRTCAMRLRKTDITYGFDVTHGKDNIGVSIQTIHPNSLATQTSLRTYDQIIEINDEFVDDDTSDSILQKLSTTKTNGSVKLYVVDTATYEHYKNNKLLLSSQELRKGQSENKLLGTHEKNLDDQKCMYYFNYN